MKSLVSLLRSLTGPLVLAIVALALSTSTSHAARITFFVQVPGYAHLGWILLVPDSNTGGRVVYNSDRGCYITDRAVRGETFCDVIEASTSAERAYTGTCLYRVTSTRGTLQQAQVRFPYTRTFTIPTNPLDDNVTVSVSTPSGPFAKRIPIGSR